MDEQQTQPTYTVSPILIDHAGRPRNNVPLSEYEGHARVTGPCGDTMEFWVHIRDGKVERATFTTDGCAISHACGSMATCLVEGRALEEADNLAQDDIVRAFDGLPADHVHCALLSAHTLAAACREGAGREPTTGSLKAGAAQAASSDAAGPENPATRTALRVAVPVVEGRLSSHFGHCQSFALLDVDPDTAQVLDRVDVAAPPHEPGLLPPWLADLGTQVIICGGMGQRAQSRFADQGIRVVVGAQTDEPDRLVADFLAGSLRVGENLCDH